MPSSASSDATVRVAPASAGSGVRAGPAATAATTARAEAALAAGRTAPTTTAVTEAVAMMAPTTTAVTEAAAETPPRRWTRPPRITPARAAGARAEAAETTLPSRTLSSSPSPTTPAPARPAGPPDVRAGRSADRDHAVDRDPGPLGEQGVDPHHGRQVAQGVAELRQRDHLHVAARRRAVGGDELLAGVLLLQRVEHPGLGRDDERARA